MNGILSASDFAVLLALADGQTHSGRSLGQQLQVSRTTVWQSVQVITRFGVAVDALPGKGYRLRAPLELLSHAQIQPHLSETAQRVLTRWFVFPAIDSTSRFIKENSLGTAHGCVCTAEMQTQGKGRRGRHWVSPLACNLYFSLAWRFPGGLNSLVGLSAATAVMVVTALVKAGVGNLQLKWPNDIFSGGKKLAGILIEASGEAHGQCQVIIGVGINVAMPQHCDWPIDQAWTDLESSKPGLSRNRLLALVLNELVDGLALFELNGLSAFLSRWRELDMLNGREVRVENEQGSAIGVAHGMDAFGALWVETADGTVRYQNAEVSVRLHPAMEHK